MRCVVAFAMLLVTSPALADDKVRQDEPPASLHLSDVRLSPIVPPPNLAPSVDLSPTSLLAPSGRVGLGLKRNEKRAGLGLGDDRLWKVQALQVGGMVAGFAALSALCGGGNCQLPKWATGWMPFTSKEYQHPMLDRGPQIGGRPSAGRPLRTNNLPR
jgi:hypothetical protein